MTSFLPDVNCYRQPFVAVVLDRFHLFAPHGHVLPKAIGYIRFTSGSAAFFCVVQYVIGDIPQRDLGIGKMWR